jgi:hypothetical protein
MSDFMFAFTANLIDPIVALVGLLIGAAVSTWPKRLAGVVFAALLMAMLVAGIDPATPQPEASVARGIALLAWAGVGAAIRNWRQRKRERA